MERSFILKAGIICLRANDSNVLSPPSATPSVLIKISMGRRGGVRDRFWRILHICPFIVGEKQTKAFQYLLGKMLYPAVWVILSILKHTHIYDIKCCEIMEENRNYFVNTFKQSPVF